MRSDKLLSRILIFIEILALAAVVVFAVVKTVAPKEEVTYELVERDSESVNSVSELEVAQIKANEGGEAEIGGDNSQTAGEQLSEADAAISSVIDMTNREVIDVTDEAKSLVAGMSTEEKVAQLFLASPETLTSTPKVNAAGDKTRASIEKYPVAGVIYSPSNVENAHQVTTLIANTQKMFEDATSLSMMIGATTSFGREEFAISNSTGGDSVVAVISNRSFDGAGDSAEVATILENSAEIADGYSIYRCKNLNIATGIKADKVVEAINNHADLVYVSEDFPAIYETVLNAVNSNEISTENLDELVQRIVTVKMSLPKAETTIAEASVNQEHGNANAGDNGGDRAPTEEEIKAALAQYQKALEAQKAEAARKAQAAGTPAPQQQPPAQ